MATYLSQQGTPQNLTEERFKTLLAIAYESLGALGSLATFTGLDTLLDAQHRALLSRHCLSRHEADHTAEAVARETEIPVNIREMATKMGTVYKVCEQNGQREFPAASKIDVELPALLEKIKRLIPGRTAEQHPW